MPPPDIRFNVAPSHIALLLEAVAIGFVFIVTVVWADAEHPLVSVTVTVYNPLAAVVTLVMEGFCIESLKLFGPLQLLIMPPADIKFKVAPEHIGLLPEAVTIGFALIVTVVWAVEEHPLLSETVTVYNPPAAVVTLGIEGF